MHTIDTMTRADLERAVDSMAGWEARARQAERELRQASRQLQDLERETKSARAILSIVEEPPPPLTKGDILDLAWDAEHGSSHPGERLRRAVAVLLRLQEDRERTEKIEREYRRLRAAIGDALNSADPKKVLREEAPNA